MNISYRVFMILLCHATSAFVPSSARPIEHPEVHMIILNHGIYSDFIHDGTMADFYKTILNSKYIDWMSEYNYNNLTIHRGTFKGTYYIDMCKDDKCAEVITDINSLTFNEFLSALHKSRKYAFDNGIVPYNHADPNMIYITHVPTGWCQLGLGGARFGNQATVAECPHYKLPAEKDMFWAGVGFTAATLILLAIWPIITCSVVEKKCQCGFDISGKTLYHIVFIVVILISFFVGGFMTGVAYINNDVYHFTVGLYILLVCGGICGVWLLSFIPILAINKLYNWKCCFHTKLKFLERRIDGRSTAKEKVMIVFNVCYLSIVLVMTLLSFLLILLSMKSNVQITASHELMEIIAGDWRLAEHPMLELSNKISHIGLGNLCQFEYSSIVSDLGVKHYVQKLWSNVHNGCYSGL